MITDKETNKPRGYAFIEYVHTRDMKGLFISTALLLVVPHLTLSYNRCVYVMQLHINKQMGKRLITGGFLWMSNVVELFQTGALAGLVADLEQLGLVVKKLTRDLWGGNSSDILIFRL